VPFNHTLVKDEQSWNADEPICVTDFEIVALVMPVQPLKHEFGIEEAEQSTTTEQMLAQFRNAEDPSVVICRPSSNSPGNAALQSKKAESPMVVTEEGIENSVKLVHPLNADSPMVSIVSGRTICSKLFRAGKSEENFPEK